MVVFLQSLDKCVCIVGRVVVDDVGWILRVDLVDILAKLAARLCLDFLDLLEATALDEGTLGLQISGKDLSELSANVG